VDRSSAERTADATWTFGDADPIMGRVELVRVYETADPVRALLVRGLLESDGIEVLEKGEGTGPYRTGPVILLVREDAVARAEELIRASEDGALALLEEETAETDASPGDGSAG
jgi:Putative prokaryotic signal transducing protein